MNKSPHPNNNNNERSETLVTSYLEELNLLQILVETLAERHYDIGHGLQQVQDGWQAIETSSIEAMASGTVIYADENHLTRTPFGTCFLFTCIKGTKEKYDLKWSSSLS